MRKKRKRYWLVRHASPQLVCLIIYVQLFFFSATSLLANNQSLGSWNILNIKYTLNESWSFFGEAQLRSLRLYNHFHYYEYKGGVNYKIHKQVQLTLGLGHYQTFQEGGDFVLPKNNNEFRLWPQLTLFQTTGKFKIEQRYRAELRFTSNGYRNRFRYRVGLSYPLGKKRSSYQPLQLIASNELFFTNNEPYFERNRCLIVLSYKPAKTSTLQAGFLYQFDYKINDETGRNFFQIGYYLEFMRKASGTTKQ
jgi:hypothetical protein